MSGAVPSTFRSRLLGGATLVGSFVNIGSPLTTEIMGAAGFDWVVFDLEHGAGDEALLLGQLQALGRSDTAALVRVEGIEGPRVLHALDLGADGILFPQLRTVDQAQRCVELCRYGKARGVARSTRTWRWGSVTRPLLELDAEIVCAVQIETIEALDNVDAIAAIDGVDVVFVGPLDLSHALGLPVGSDHPELLERIRAVASAARAHGKAAGMLVGTVEQARVYLELGFSFLGCASDGVLLTTSSGQLAASLHQLVGDRRFGAVSR